MNIKYELIRLMQKHNKKIEQLAPIISLQPKRFLKRFEQDKIRYSDAQAILSVLGYEMEFIKRY